MHVEAVRAFVTVAEEGQFQLAGGRLGISQQAVSKRIATLESELGTALFTRTATGAVLTPDGRTFLPQAQRVLVAVSDAFDSVQPPTRPLRVDVLTRHVAAADLLRAFHEQHPDLPVELVTSGGARDTLRSLLTGEIDAGYTYLRSADALDPCLDRAYAYLEPIEVVVGARHPLAGRSSVPPSELGHFPAWVPGIVAGTEWEAFYQDLAAAFTLNIDPTGYDTGTGSVFDAIAGSRTLLTFVGEKSRVGWPARLGLVRLPVVGPTPCYPWSLLWRADIRHPGARQLVAHVHRTFAPPVLARSWLPGNTRDDLRSRIGHGHEPVQGPAS